MNTSRGAVMAAMTVLSGNTKGNGSNRSRLSGIDSIADSGVHRSLL